MTAADVLVEGLIDWGVEVIFGLPGDGITGIMESLRTHQDQIRFIQARLSFCSSGSAVFPRPKVTRFLGFFLIPDSFSAYDFGADHPITCEQDATLGCRYRPTDRQNACGLAGLRNPWDRQDWELERQKSKMENLLFMGLLYDS
jgi:hypothetical protein